LAVEVLAPLVDALSGVIAWLAEVVWALFRSCARSLRFAFSSSFRATEFERLENRGLIYRALYATWGVVAVAACFVLVGSLIYWASRPGPTPTEACAKLDLKQLAKCVQAIREAKPK
jgi:hypothetical protein